MHEEIIGGSTLYDEKYREVQERLRQRGEEAVRMAEIARKPSELRVLIADDQELVRNGLRLILSSYDNIRVIGEAGNGVEAVEMARKLKPDVVLMDIRMPVLNGIDATTQIRHDPQLEGMHVLILTTFDIDEYVYDALAAGAAGFMLKDAEPDDIAQAIEVVAQGDALIQPSITRRLIEAFVGSRKQKAHSQETMGVLTDREREITELVARGLSNDQIAGELFISPATVKTHVARIMSKLGVHDRAQLVVFAYENGVVIPGMVVL